MPELPVSGSDSGFVPPQTVLPPLQESRIGT